MDESGSEMEYNFLARPIVAGIATAGVLAISGGLGGGLAHFGKQCGAGAASILVSDYASGMFFGGNAGMLLSPAMSGAAYMVLQKMVLKDDMPMMNAVVTGAAIDIASQWMLNPVGRALGLV
jgi:hypothetical protein